MKARMKTRKAYTISALEGRFTCFSPKDKNLILNTEYLNHMICLYLDNTKSAYNDIVNTRIKPESAAWSAFKILANNCINEDFSEQGTLFYATSQQLRDFLKKYGYGYEAVAESVKYVRISRQEIFPDIDDMGSFVKL